MNNTSPSVRDTHRILRKSEVCKRARVTGITLDRWAKSGKFPRPFKIGGGRYLGWYEADIEAWLSQQGEVND